MGVRQALREPHALDREDVLAALGTGRSILRHEGRRVHEAGEMRVRILQREMDPLIAGKLGRGSTLVACHALPFLGDEERIDLGEGVSVAEGLGFGQDMAILADEAVGREDEVLRGFAPASIGIHVAADEPCALAGDEAAPIGSLADNRIRAGEVADEGGAGLRMGNRRRIRHPEVLAELCRHYERRQRIAAEELVCAEGHILEACHVDAGDRGRTRREVPSLIELVVGRKEALRDDAEEVAGVQGSGAVVELPIDSQGHADEDQGIEILSRLRDLGEPLLGVPQQRLLQEQVLAGVGREAELRQHHDLCPFVHRTLDCFLDMLDIECDIGHPYLGRHRCDRNEAIPHDGSFLLDA